MAYRSRTVAIRSLADVAKQRGGYFTAAEARRAGFGYSHLSYHVQAGNFEKVGHGVYRVTLLPLSEHDDLIRLSLWSRDRRERPQAVVSHRTALGFYGLSDLIPASIDLTVPRGFRKPTPRGCRLHRAEIAAEDVRDIGGFRITTAARTLADLSDDATITADQFASAVSRAVDGGLIRRSEARQLLLRRGPRRSAKRSGG